MGVQRFCFNWKVIVLTLFAAHGLYCSEQKVAVLTLFADHGSSAPFGQDAWRAGSEASDQPSRNTRRVWKNVLEILFNTTVLQN